MKKVLLKAREAYPIMFGIGSSVVSSQISKSLFNLSIKMEAIKWITLSTLIGFFVAWVLWRLFKLSQQVKYQEKIIEAIKIRYGWRTQKIIDVSGQPYSDIDKENTLIETQILSMYKGELYDEAEIKKIVKESFYQ